MLSKESLPLIQASVPLLRENGVAITNVFYQSMFAAHPELANIFNAGNQATGQQQQSLASAVYAYAANIENPDALAPVLARIAHKHAAIGIKPAQYTIVGKHLLAAIKEVLGDIATPDIMAAWDEAYWLLAGELIAIEAKLYFDANIKGGEHWKELIISRIEDENEITRSLYLTPPSGETLNSFAPGQYVSVEMDVPALGVKQQRQYSLSDAPYEDHWRITVKKEVANESTNTPAGNVSNLIHALKVGDTLKTSPAYGEFCLSDGPSNHPTNPVVLISAGVGITPMVSILKTLQKKSPNIAVRFLHAARDENNLALLADVNAAKNELTDFRALYFLDSASNTDDTKIKGRMNIADYSGTVILPNADYYLCGSLPFMREQRKSLLSLGVDANNIQYEVFGPDLLMGLD